MPKYYVAIPRIRYDVWECVTSDPHEAFEIACAGAELQEGESSEEILCEVTEDELPAQFHRVYIDNEAYTAVEIKDA